MATTPDESRIDYLALQTTIDDYGDMSIVTIPGVENLSSAERSQITHKAQQLRAGSSHEADRLLAALRDLTPPVDEEDEREDSRRREALARSDLEAEGCPPCYPSSADIYSSHTLPKECRAIVEYWASFPGAHDMPLSAQLFAWRKFRIFQRQTRRRRFKDFEDEVRQRRQRHELNPSVYLVERLEQQNCLERWLEYQNYQLLQLEIFETKLDRRKKELTESRKAYHTDALSHIIHMIGEDIKRQMVLLDWIELKAQVMHLNSGIKSSSSNKANAVNQGCRNFGRRRKGEKKAATTLGKENRVSKPVNERKIRHRIAAGRAQAPKSEPVATATKNLGAIVEICDPEKAPRSQNSKTPNKTRRLKDKTLIRGPDGPPRIAKTQTSSPRLVSAGQLEIRTRVGRISKPPDRWGFRSGIA